MLDLPALHPGERLTAAVAGEHEGSARGGEGLVRIAELPVDGVMDETRPELARAPPLLPGEGVGAA